IANAVIGSLLPVISFFLARRFGLGDAWALLVSLIVAVDPASVVYASYLGPEALANVLLAVSVLLLLQSLEPSANRPVVWAVGAALALGLSCLARPSSYLLWLPLAVLLVVLRRGQWKAILIFAVTSVIVITPWIVHNGLAFGNYTYSTI